MGSDNHLLLRVRRGKREKTRRLPLPGRNENFRFEKRGNLTLVYPEASARWSDDNRAFRSLIYDRDRSVVSVGWPKFFEPDQRHGREDARRLQQALEAGETVRLTRKEDGSLVIRSVIRKRVVMRTRTSFDGEHLASRFEAVASERYPLLLDPAWEPDRSLLFEYVSPTHRIVLPYPEDDLIHLGGVLHADLSLESWEETAARAARDGLRLVESRLAEPGDSLQSLRAAADSDPTHEGWVARWGQEGLLKLKGRPYRIAHRQRFELHGQRVLLTLQRRRHETPESLVAAMGAQDDPPEIQQYLSELWQRYQRFDAEVDQQLEQLQGLAQQHASLSRKRFSAEIAQPLGNPGTPALMALREKKTEQARTLLAEAAARERFGDPTAELDDL